ncbi:glycine betaine ABC transporter substrate-binding protein [Georgenia sp. 10Sc9-8]|uniref:Glycine betaine ABC transporter substrate-binding protein n=1 Tax=Georgenia halotolerans TaxID=3028317 RepID=A0ABT5U173_9MICO|nr:glycine betaine ABC transporter substrate-binding protein [Georgenia halotolerans]
MLEDDEDLQTVDNIIPAIHAQDADDALVAALDAVSATLDQETLIGLNRSVDVERQTASEVAAEHFEETGISVPADSGSGEVVIGAGNFSESAILAELYALALSEAGYSTEVRTIGNRETYLPALESGELTVVPEYAGTLTEFLNLQGNGPDAEPVASNDLAATVAELRSLGDTVGLAFGEPADAANQNAYAVTAPFAQEHGVSSLSELAEACGGIVLGGPPECPDRPFCQPGLEDTYGLEVAEFVSLDAGGPLTKQALRSGDVSLGMVFSSDPELTGSE